MGQTLCVILSSLFRSTFEQAVQLGGRLYLAEFVLWPPAQFVNFTLIPSRYVLLSVWFTVYLFKFHTFTRTDM